MLGEDSDDYDDEDDDEDSDSDESESDNYATKAFNTQNPYGQTFEMKKAVKARPAFGAFGGGFNFQQQQA